jgi:hypothetical protein
VAAPPPGSRAAFRQDRAGPPKQLAWWISSLARHLLYGEWLRERRRLVAHQQLRTAHELLLEIGIEAFAERAAREPRELLATGATARKRRIETSGDLTPQEAQVARLAREGFSNPDR